MTKTNSDLWAEALTNDRLATDLQRLAVNVRFHTGEQRTALLLEAARRLAEQDMRAATEAETAAYLAGHAAIEGAVETGEGLLVPAELEPFVTLEQDIHQDYFWSCTCGSRGPSRSRAARAQEEGQEHGEQTGHDASNV